MGKWKMLLTGSFSEKIYCNICYLTFDIVYQNLGYIRYKYMRKNILQHMLPNFLYSIKKLGNIHYKYIFSKYQSCFDLADENWPADI